MLESQISYITRTIRRQRNMHATRVEVNSQLYTRYNQSIQKALGHTVWNGCNSWYIDENGHNSTGWPGFTLTYRWLTRFSRLNEFLMTGHSHTDVPFKLNAQIIKTGDPIENSIAFLLRNFLRFAFKPFIGKPFGIHVQRAVAAILAPTMLGRSGTLSYHTNLNGVPTRVTAPKNGEKKGALLFLHGGAFCLGSPWTHRSMTTRLAFESGFPVYALDYRLAPENPYPACIDDAVKGFKALLELGYQADQIVVAGDSAGGGLSLSLALKLRELGLPQPAGLVLVSPMTDGKMTGKTFKTKASDDPMLRAGWAQQSQTWLKVPEDAACFHALEQDLTGLAPMLIQVGDQEILLDDSLRLAKRAQSQGAACQLEVYENRWHVFHLQSAFLKSAETALKRMAAFAAYRIEKTGIHPIAQKSEQAHSRKVA